MYKSLIEYYLPKLTYNDINNFANKNNIILLDNEDKIIYDFIINNYKRILSKDITVFSLLENKVSNNTYNQIINLYNIYKEKIK